MDDVGTSTAAGLLDAATTVNEVILAIAAVWLLNKCWQLLRKAVSGKGA